MWNPLQSLLLLSVAISAYAASTEPKIVGGFPAEQDATLHQVSIRYRTLDELSFGRGHICGGSLINNRTVLTAAHCLVDLETGQRFPASTFRVVGGSVDRMQQTENTVVVNVDKTYVHTGFDPNNIENDIALMILSTPIPNEHPTLRPIERASSQPSSATSCQTSGWGTTIFGQNVSPNTLLAVNVTVQPTELCNGTTSYDGHLRAGMFCAGQTGKDACQGDSGGPLVCDGKLAGVVSHGKNCGLDGYPGIYSDVAYYRGWIEKCLAGGCPSGAGPTVASWGLLVSLLVVLVFQGK
uniref:Putative trypsin-like serine protease n=1 Tax=Culex tarsalis TaxID=7177 RepID=A0A1Q3FET4_CULTA